MSETHPFAPDWCLAPSEHLKDWLSENGMSARVLSVGCGGNRIDPPALTLVTEVLDRKPLTQAHADCLARGTFVSPRFWLALEHIYRAGLAAGLKDVSEDEDDASLRTRAGDDITQARQASDDEAWGGRGPSASYADWLAEGGDERMAP